MDVGVRGSLDFMRTDYLVVSAVSAEDSLTAWPPWNSAAGEKKPQHDYLTPAKICQNMHIMLFWLTVGICVQWCGQQSSAGSLECHLCVQCILCVLMFVDVWQSDFERIDE